MHATPSTSSDNSEEKEERGEQADSNGSNEDKRKEDSDTNDENSTHAKKRVHNPKAYLLAQKEVYKSAQQLDLTYVLRKNGKKKKVFLSKFFPIRSISRFQNVGGDKSRHKTVDSYRRCFESQNTGSHAGRSSELLLAPSWTHHGEGSKQIHPRPPALPYARVARGSSSAYLNKSRYSRSIALLNFILDAQLIDEK